MLRLGGYHVDSRRVPVRENCSQKTPSRKQETKFGLLSIIRVKQYGRILFTLGMKSDVRKGTGCGLLETKAHWIGKVHLLDRPMPLSTNMQLVNHNIMASTGQSF